MCGWLKADLTRITNPAPTTDPPGAQPENIREILRLSELFLDGTIRLGIATDARALSLSAMLAGATTALFAGGITLLLTRGISVLTFALAAAAFVAGGCLVVALWFAIGATWPRDFNIAGNYLKFWNKPEDLAGPLAVAMLAQARVYQDQIERNRQLLERNANRIDTAMAILKWTLLAALATGLASFAIGSILARCAS
jgi:hypothetical protein